MQIALLHSFYGSKSVSGENIAVVSHLEALREGGYDVRLIERRTDAMEGTPGYRFGSSVRVATGLDFAGGARPRARSASEVLLVHNTFPNFGARLLNSWPGPVANVMHNFRSLCANGLLLRNQEPCSLCVSGSALNAVVHRCYRNSFAATLPLAVPMMRKTTRRPAFRTPDLIIVQSERAFDTYIEAGVPPHRMELIPGFVDASLAAPAGKARLNRWLFVGRLSEEKGLRQLAAIWPHGEGLDVIGEGPQRTELQRCSPASWNYQGACTHEEVLAALPQYLGLIFPGLAREGAHPLVVREALAAGLPVVSASGTSAADAIQGTQCGSVYLPGSAKSLRDGLEFVRSKGPAARLEAVALFERRFSREAWLSRMSEVLVKLFSNHETGKPI